MTLNLQKQKNTALARELSNTRFGQSQLESYGLSVSAAGTTYGNGRGGVKLENEAGRAEVPKQWKPNPSCSKEQLEVLKQVEAGGNVFFTGSAGKFIQEDFSLLTDDFRYRCWKVFPPERVMDIYLPCSMLRRLTALIPVSRIRRLLEHLCRPFQVTATTGIAALEINGSTLHSFAALGLCDEPIQVLYDKLSRSKAKENWKTVKTLIIDEISMIDPEFFTKLSTLGKLIRERGGAFGMSFAISFCRSNSDQSIAGGIQLIVSGDFFQLPPVPNKVPKCIRCGQ